MLEEVLMPQPNTSLFVRRAVKLWMQVLAHALAVGMYPEHKRSITRAGNACLKKLLAHVSEGSTEEMADLALFFSAAEDTPFDRELAGFRRIQACLASRPRERLKPPVAFADFVEEIESAGDALWRHLMSTEPEDTQRLFAVYQFLERVQALTVPEIEMLVHESAPPEKRGFAAKRATTLRFLREGAEREGQKFRLN